MAFSLLPFESLSWGVVRILTELFSSMSGELSDETVNLDERIHNTRTNVKKCRAMLRLLQVQLGNDVYRFENLALRDIGRLLSDNRDSFILVETLDVLSESLSEQDKTGWESVRQTLNENYLEHTRLFRENNVKEHIIKELQILATRAKDWQIEDSDDLFWQGIEKIYKNGQDHMQTVFKEKSDVLMHEWRKDVKYLWYQLLILTSEQPDDLTDLAEEFHILSGYLGIDHDLYELKQFLLQNPNAGPVSAIRNMLKSIDQEKARLESLAHADGNKLFIESPDVWINHLKSSWQIHLK